MASPSKKSSNKKDDLQRINHFISRSEARELIGRYRENRKKILHPDLLSADKQYGLIPHSEAFNEKSVLAILSQPGCVGIRIHYGMKTQKDKKYKDEIPLIVAVIVGVDSQGRNMWGGSPAKSKSKKAAGASMIMAAAPPAADGFAFINEDSQRCPPYQLSQPQP